MSGITYYPEGLDDNTTLDETLTDGPTGDDVLAAHQNNQNAAIKALELKVGIDGSEDISSIDYRLDAVEGALSDAVDTATFEDHSARHENGGADEINVAGLSGELADPQPPKSHGNEAHDVTFITGVDWDEVANKPSTFAPTTHGNEAHSETYLTTVDIDLDDLGDVDTAGVSNGDVLSFDGANWVPTPAGTPGAHAASHEPSGGDEIKNLSLDTLSLVQFDETLDEPAVVTDEITIDLSTGSVFVCELDDDVTDVTITNVASAGRASSFTLVLVQNGTGGWEVTWPASVLWPNGEAPTLPSGANEDIVFVFFTVDGGTTWRGMESGRLFA